MFPISMHTGLLFSVFVHRLSEDSAVLLGCLKTGLEKTGRFSCHPSVKSAGKGVLPSGANVSMFRIGNGL